MKSSTFTLLLVLIIFLHTAYSQPNSTLRHVNLVYRHGDRSPVYIYPTDRHQRWPDGLGWLSNIGKNQQFALGQYLRTRYDGFINVSRYHHEEITIESSAEQRCLMSAYSNLAGLFPPAGDQIWKNDFPWQPIPVETRPKTEDNKLAMGAPCPRYWQLLGKTFQTDYVKELDLKNKDLFKLIEDNTGIKKESMLDVWAVTDDLICEKAHNISWNSWANETIYTKLVHLKAVSFDLLYYFPEMAKLKGGPLLKEMIENMQNAAKKPNTTSALPRVHMYSAHDSTLCAVLKAMEVFDVQQPSYASLLMVELHEIGNEFQVKVLFRNNTSVEPYELVHPDCPLPCTLSAFAAATKHNVPVNWTAECVAHPDPSTTSIATWIALAVGGGFILTIAAVFIIAIVRHCRQSNIAYARM